MTPLEFNWQRIDAKLNELHQEMLDQQGEVEQEIVKAKQLREDLETRLDKSEKVLDQLKNAASLLVNLINTIHNEKREKALLLTDLRGQLKLYGLQPEDSKPQGNLVRRITGWLRLSLLRWK